jgi:hypothetical protein
MHGIHDQNMPNGSWETPTSYPNSQPERIQIASLHIGQDPQHLVAIT